MYHISLSLDENNIIGLLKVIKSIIVNTKKIDEIKFSILVYDNKDELTKIIDDKFENINYEIKEFVNYGKYINFLNENMYVNDTTGKFEYISNVMNFARFYLPIIFESIDIAVYLDSDIIVRCDITNIFNDKNLPTDKNDIVIASPLNRPLECMNFDEKLNMIGMGFNTGVYILNFDYWRKENLTDRCEEIMIRHKNEKLFKLGTQPIINILFYKKCINIDKRWNITGLGSNELEYNRLKNGYILHWSGPNKPWTENGYNKKIWYECEI